MQPSKNDISAKEILLTLQEYFFYLRSKWLIIAIAGLIGGIAAFSYAFFSPIKYTAKLSFVLSNGQSATGSGFNLLASQFGLDLTGNTNNDLFAGENIVELMQTRKIVKSALFTKSTDSATNLISFILSRPLFQEDWKPYKGLKRELSFPEEEDKLSPRQDSIVAGLQEFLVNKYVQFGKKDKKLSIYEMEVTSPDQLISYYLCKSIVAQAADFYIDTKTKVAKQSLDMVQREADSLKALLGGTIRSVASSTDRTFNLNTAYQVQRADIQNGQAEAQILTVAYGEVLKNLEIAKLNLQKEKPLYQTIDEPFLPLTKIRKSTTKFFVLGFVGASFMCISLLAVRKIYTSILVD